MDAIAKQQFIQARAIERKIKWSSHALGELAPEGLGVDQIESALERAQVIEDYPHAHRYLPDCLILAFTEPHRPVHAVVAINEPSDYILIVTVHTPKREEWQDDWRTRQ